MNYKIYDQLPQEAKKIRIKVFMEEQGFKDEFDDLDEVCNILLFLIIKKQLERVAIIMMILYKQMLLEE
ncbi:hypothetical protein [Faecalibacillus intestinalis]|uniref:hypothetical protein n=1 Tax=Faecalibacillus intestinalis TaxID=1982626 RepID=UPI002FD9B04C